MNNYAPANNFRSPMPLTKSGLSALPENPVPGMAYVPFQTDTTTYDEMQALKVGTLFPVLNKPFLGSGRR